MHGRRAIHHLAPDLAVTAVIGNNDRERQTQLCDGREFRKREHDTGIVMFDDAEELDVVGPQEVLGLGKTVVEHAVVGVPSVNTTVILAQHDFLALRVLIKKLLHTRTAP